MSGSGNGVDLGSIAAMLTNLLVIGEDTRRDIGNLQVKVADLDRKVMDLDRKVMDLDRKVMELDRKVMELDRKVMELDRTVTGLAGEVAELRSEVRAYHGSVMGHGIMLTELDERMTRVESHLNLPPKSH